MNFTVYLFLRLRQDTIIASLLIQSQFFRYFTQQHTTVFFNDNYCLLYYNLKNIFNLKLWQNVSH